MATPKKVKKVKGKVAKQLTTIFNLFAIPNKAEKITAICKLVISGKAIDLTGNQFNKIDIGKLDVLTAKPIISLLTSLYNGYTLTIGQWGIKNQYGLCIGIIDKLNSYKAMVAYHKANGGLIVNGNKHFTFAHALDVASGLDLTIAQGKGQWGVLTVTDKNLTQVEKFCVKLLTLKRVK